MKPIYEFKMRASRVIHSCVVENMDEPIHPQKLIDFIQIIETAINNLQYNGIIKSLSNSSQITVDFDECFVEALLAQGCGKQPMSILNKLKGIPNIRPDAMLTKDEANFCIEIEKTNKKTIWFDFIKFMMLIRAEVADFGVLLVPRNYAHAKGVWDLFKEARFYKHCLGQFAGVDEKLLSKIAIIGYSSETLFENKWLELDSSLITEIKNKASKAHRLQMS